MGPRVEPKTSVDDPLSHLDWIRSATEALATLLADFGVPPLPVLWLQIILFVLGAASCGWLIYSGWPKPWEERTKLMGILVTGLLVLGLLGSWLVEIVSPLPDVVSGVVQIDHDADPGVRTGARVRLFDVRNRDITVEGGAVDSVTGRFAVAYAKQYGERPHLLEVHTKGCLPFKHPLSLGRLRAKGDVRVEFECARES